ncbi:MAG: aminoacetone oxidase family FAD-binding enzyme [Clostridia bacterium]|nr:aminoacetone oxidase family FAD-binding enzyme [Clostridia bacterium]
MENTYTEKNKKIKNLIVGGGAAGLALAVMLKEGKNTLLLERGERVGRKLSATGNGQGNVTNLGVDENRYFSSEAETKARLKEIFSRFSHRETVSFLEGLGGLFLPDERGRVYPAGRQASAVTDLMRFAAAQNGVELETGSMVTSVECAGNGFIVSTQKGKIFAENVVLCAGGKAAKNFGTDGNGYALAKSLGHTVSALYPSLVQLKTDARQTKILKGIRVNDARVTAYAQEKTLAEVRGDLIFTDYGVSGDAIFRLSAFVADRVVKGERIALEVDLLPDIAESKLLEILSNKAATGLFSGANKSEILCGIINNQVGRVATKLFSGGLNELVRGVKNFPIQVTGTLGFDYAQVTKGGVLLSETTKELESKKHKGLYFAGEILDVDGECGGFNLQWAFSSAHVVASALNEKE